MIKIEFDIKQFTKALDDIAKKQIPFATAAALSKTAVEVKQEVQKEMKRVFDRPTRYTLGAVYTRPARKNLLEALVWLKDSGGKGTPATKYLWAQVFGGKRGQKRSESGLTRAGIMSGGQIAVPAKTAPLDQYGNIRGSQMTSMLSYFKAHREWGQNRTERSAKRRRGRKAEWWVLKQASQPIGIMRRIAGDSKPFLIFSERNNYRKRLDFVGISKRVFEKRFPSIFAAEFEIAQRTAR